MQRSIARQLTAINLLGTGIALLLASLAFFAYTLNNSRRALLDDLTIQAQIAGYNSITPLLFNDPPSARNTLSALRAAPHITYAGVYRPDGQFFAGYSRDAEGRQLTLPNSTPANRLFQNGDFAVVREIRFKGDVLGYVYIRSDVRAIMQQAESYLVILVVISLVSFTVAFIISGISQRVISAPIVELAGTATAVSRGKDYSLRAAPVDTAGEVGLLVRSFNQMLSEIQARDVALQESERQFRTLADSIPQLAWIAEANGDLSWYNQRWYDYTGATSEQMMGWGWQAVQDPAVLPEVISKWKASIKSGSSFEMVFPLKGRDGNYRDFLTVAVPVRDTQGKIVRWFGTNTDITERRRAEEALRKSEKLAATGRLAASIAHEINNPLEAISNLLYLARRRPSGIERYLVTAEQELDRIAEITKQTLGFYRDTSTPVELDLADIANGVFVLYDRKLKFKKIDVKKRFASGAILNGFPGEIRQVLANLVANAIDAVSSGGYLGLKIAPSHEWSGDQSPGVRVTLLDNGSGIAADRLKKIFEPFYTTKKDTGTGLGLWLTENLIQKRHGKLRVRSSMDPLRHGTAFSIFFPFEIPNQPTISGASGNRAEEDRPHAAGV